MTKKLLLVTLLVGCAIFALAVFVFAYLGIYSRFFADDWCFNADFKQLGIWGTIQGYTWITHYASNRFSLVLFSGLLYLLGVSGAQILPGITLVLMLGGIYWNLANVNLAFSRPLPKVVLLLTAAIITYYTFYLAINRYQNLFFRSGVLPYTTPIVFGLYVFGLITKQITMDSPSKLMILLAAPLAFLTGGFSEAACASLTSALTLFVVAACFAKRRGQQWAIKSFPIALTALVFVLFALLVLLLSPANKARQLYSYGKPTNLVLVPLLALEYSYDFISGSLEGTPIPHLIIIVSFGGLAILAKPFIKNNSLLSLRSTGLVLLGTAIVSILLIAASQAPSIYVEFYPSERTAIIARFTMTSGLAIISWFMGYTIAYRWNAKWLIGLAVIAMFLSYTYAGRSISINIRELPRFVERAKTWDERDTMIRDAKARGILSIDVRGIDSTYTGRASDFHPEPNYWINRCADNYYGMDEIRATLP